MSTAKAVIWRAFKEFWGELQLLGVETFRENRDQDVSIPSKNKAGDFEAQWIRLDELKGDIVAHAEEDEQFPRLKSEQRAVISKLLQFAGTDPALGAAVDVPANMGYIRDAFGLEGFKLPDEEARQKCRRVIELLLKGQPAMAMGPTGPTLQPSIPVDDVLDNLAVNMSEIKLWASEDAGQDARANNPMGYANVKAYFTASKDAMQAQQAPPQTKPPSESIPFKELPAPGKVQQAAKAGIHITPQDVVEKDLHDAMLKHLSAPPKEVKKDEETT